MSNDGGMKRFGLFAGYEYPRVGGWSDFRASFDTADEAAARVQQFGDDFDWFQVVDFQTGTVVVEET